MMTARQMLEAMAEFERLSFLIAFHKVLYYYPERLPKWLDATISDDEYDRMERNYLVLCQRLNLQNQLVHKLYPGVPDAFNGTGMMEVDFDHPVVQSALHAASLMEVL